MTEEADSTTKWRLADRTSPQWAAAEAAFDRAATGGTVALVSKAGIFKVGTPPLEELLTEVGLTDDIPLHTRQLQRDHNTAGNDMPAVTKEAFMEWWSRYRNPPYGECRLYGIYALLVVYLAWLLMLIALNSKSRWLQGIFLYLIPLYGLSLAVFLADTYLWLYDEFCAMWVTWVVYPGLLLSAVHLGFAVYWTAMWIASDFSQKSKRYWGTPAEFNKMMGHYMTLGFIWAIAALRAGACCRLDHARLVGVPGWLEPLCT